MADRRNTSSGGEFGFFEGGTSPFQKAMQSSLARTPEAFSYNELEQKYPTRQVMPIMPTHIRRELDDDILAEKEREVAVKVRQAQLNNYDSELNEKKAIAEQIIAARPEFALLNPQDPDFLEKSDQLFMKYPLLESSNDFMQGMFARLLRINERTIGKIKLKTPEDITDRVGKAMTEKSKFLQLKKEGLIDPNQAEEYIGMLDKQINEAKGQLGIESISPAKQPELAPPVETQKNISQNQQNALQWLQQNPTHPSADRVKAKLQRQGIL
jgi:hypothetical protein